MIIDTHCHYNHKKLRDVDACLQRAFEADVRHSIVVGYDLESSEEAVRLADLHPGVLSAVIGVHPHDSKDWNSATEKRLRSLSENPNVVAIGEIGLDYFHDFSPRDKQFEVFRIQMKLARELNLPVVIHCREAYEDTLGVLEAEGVGEVGGVMHCWAGNLEQAKRTVELGMALGFGGTLTYKSADSIRDAAVQMPETALLLETDAPYLTPIPHRGKRNEPAYTRLVADQLSTLLNRSYSEIAALTTANALRVFPRLNSILTQSLNA